jgi:hypothetical protein
VICVDWRCVARLRCRNSLEMFAGCSQPCGQGKSVRVKVGSGQDCVGHRGRRALAGQAAPTSPGHRAGASTGSSIVVISR